MLQDGEKKKYKININYAGNNQNWLLTKLKNYIKNNQKNPYSALIF